MSTHSCIHVHDEEIFSTMYIRGCFVPLDVLYLFCWWVYHVIRGCFVRLDVFILLVGLSCY